MIKSKGPAIHVSYNGAIQLKTHEGEGMLLENIPEEWIPWFQAYGSKQSCCLALPAIEVSPFTAKVLEFLQTISFGEIFSYGEVACHLGLPRGARAVGSACGKNPLPLLIPCHRVVGNQGLGGFSQGLEVKKRLLEHEVGTAFAPTLATRRKSDDRTRNTTKDIGARVCS